jgi:MSHA pilin protein MshC
MNGRAVAREQGVTLTEFVLVLAILAIIGGLSAPRLFGASEFRARLFFDDVRTGARYAQKLAVASGCGVQVSITPSSYALTQQPGCAGAVYTQPVSHPATGASSYTGQAPGGVTLASSVNPFRFDALGRAVDGAGTTTDVTVTVGTATFTVVGESGFVRVP